ncbi:hypothetical protein DFH29DRAFT_999481 [Suillus ampliporus]|nr:hypothetical protein DFH29DRAFT_999481 [Suillus ampliporus]
MSPSATYGEALVQSNWTTKDNVAGRSTPGGFEHCKLPRYHHRFDSTHDLEDKVKQIQAMDLIYGGSYFTIYAAGGTSARDPLPGLRPQTRTPQQHIEVIQGLHLAVPLPTPLEALTLSAWSTRGWTYQEGSKSTLNADMISSAKTLSLESKRPRIVHPSFTYTGVGNFTYLQNPSTSSWISLSWITCLPLGRIRGRNLTVESDIVDAFTALTNALAKGFELGGGDPAKAFHYGMTLTDLDHALLWQHDPHTPRARRSLAGEGDPPWPSWAWAAWRGTVRYEGEALYARFNSHSNPPRVTETIIDPWYIVDRNGDTAQLDVRRIHRAFVYPIPEAAMNPYCSPKGILAPSRLTLDNDRPLEPGTLIFRTTSSHFSVVRRGTEENEDSSADFYHGLFNIFSSASTWVGSVILALDPAPPTFLEFIVLSRTSTNSGTYDEEILGKFYSGCMLYVMAVSRNEGLMERVGLGIIHEAAWIASSAQEKVVFLR